MNHRILTLAAAPLAVIAIAAPFAYANSQHRTVSEGAQEAHLLGLTPRFTTINMETCKFALKEVDVRPGPSEPYARAEDLRHDALDNCLRHRLNTQKTPAPDTDGVTGYTQVTASGTGQTVTASCPVGDVVTGGGSPDEVTGSYPSSASSWTIGRDHLSPKTMTVIATCAAKAAS